MSTHSPNRHTRPNRAWLRRITGRGGPRRIPSVNRWLAELEKKSLRAGEDRHARYGGPLATEDGLHLSVIASNVEGFSGTYSSRPRQLPGAIRPWTTVEVGSYSGAVPELEDHYLEETRDGGVVIYAHVPVAELDELLAAHGGASEAPYPGKPPEPPELPKATPYRNPESNSELKRRLMR